MLKFLSRVFRNFLFPSFLSLFSLPPSLSLHSNEILPGAEISHTGPKMSVQMHPQACRHALPSSSSSLSSPVSNSTPSPLASTPFFPQLDTIFPTPSTSRLEQHERRATTSSSTRLDASSHSGLQVDPSIYPLYSLSHHAPQIRVLSASQYAELHERDSKTKLDEKELFPWSHGGADEPDSAAARYFGFGYGQAAKTPK